MQKFLLPALNLIGILFVVGGVFVFANVLTGKNFNAGELKFLSSADAGMFLILLGLILFAVSFIAGKIFGKQF